MLATVRVDAKGGALLLSQVLHSTNPRQFIGQIHEKSIISSFRFIFFRNRPYFFVENFAASHAENKQLQRSQEYLVNIQKNLQDTVDSIISENLLLANQLTKHPEAFYNPESSTFFQQVQTQLPVVSITLIRDATVFFCGAHWK